MSNTFISKISEFYFRFEEYISALLNKCPKAYMYRPLDRYTVVVEHEYIIVNQEVIGELCCNFVFALVNSLKLIKLNIIVHKLLQICNTKSQKKKYSWFSFH